MVLGDASMTNSALALALAANIDGALVNPDVALSTFSDQGGHQSQAGI